MTIEQLQNALLDELRARDMLVGEAGQIYRAEAEADHAAELAHAKAFLQAEGTVDARKAACVVIVAREKLAARIAGAQSQATRDRLKAHESAISAYQSLLRLAVSEADAVRYGQHAGA